MARALIAAGLPSRLRARTPGRGRSPRRGADTIELERCRGARGRDARGPTPRRSRSGGSAATSDLRELDAPIVVLIGGATGTGKSTVATEVAYRLGITRVTSTDFVRQTMRAFFSEEFMPSVHYSSFEAGRGAAGGRARRPAIRCSSVSSTRRGHVLVGVEAAIDRAQHERLVGRARGRPPRAGDAARAAAGRGLRPRASWRSRTSRSTRRTSRSATRRPAACAAREVPRPVRRHPPPAGLHRRPGLEIGRAGVQNGNIEQAIAAVMEARVRTRRGAHGVPGGERGRRRARSRPRPRGGARRPVPVRDVRPRDGAGGARRGALARPSRPGRRPGGGVAAAMAAALEPFAIDGRVVIGPDDGPLESRTADRDRRRARRPGRRPARGARRRRARRKRGDVDDRGRRARLAARRCPTCTCARWRSGPRAWADRPPPAGRGEHRGDRRGVRTDSRRTSPRSSSTVLATTT